MKKAMWCLVLPALCAAGCIRMDSRNKVQENDGRIEVAGSRVDVNQAIRQLIADRGWTSEQEGAWTSSTSSGQTGTRLGTQGGPQPPERRHEESGDVWISAKTDEGKVVHFDITRAGGRPVTVRIGVEDGADVSRAEVTADLARRLQLPAHPRRRDRGPLTIRLEPLAQSSTDPNVYTAHWTARGDWPYPAEYIQFEVREEDRSSRWYSIPVGDSTTWSISNKDATEGPARVRSERPAGVMVLEGRRSYFSARGTATFEPNAVYVDALAQIVHARPTTSELLEFFFRLDLDYARRMKQVLADELTLPSLLTLSNHHVAPDYVKGIREAGYAFSVEQIVRLTNYHISLETLRGFQRAGYDFSVDQLIHIRNYHLEVSDFTAFRDAGYNLSIDEMIRAKNYHVPVEMVRTLHQAGLQYDLDEIIKLRNYHVPPEYLIAFRRGGYQLSVDDTIKARNYHVDAEDAARFKKIGYSFSLDELIKLHNYHVPVEFIMQLHDPNYENFTADELIDFHQRHINAEAINKIRATKRKAQP